MSENNQIDFDRERGDIFRKLKDIFDVVASMAMDGRERRIIRLRAAKVLADLTRILRLFLLDEEKVEELAKEVAEIRKELDRREAKKRARSYRR